MITDEQLKVAFRRTELQRRAGRRERLLNEMKLDTESLSSEDLKIHRLAAKSLVKQQLEFERETRASYWQRLWAAIKGG